ncbi:MAG TPA: hypothetical protein VHW09_17185 [Bryobacteraceae bacterium]|jgi:hypothetical protein|nr:hypothetical protein [Bryobacteraceae bacterium]
MARTMAGVSPLVFLCACVLVFLRPSFGYLLGLLAGLAALPWLVWSELSLAPWNTWVLLVLAHDQHDVTAFWNLRILAAALIAMSTGCAVIRLVPARLLLRQTPVCRRSWPAVSLGMLVVAEWLVHSVTPYVVPECRKATSPEFQILHMEKRGLRIHQVAVSAYKDGRVYSSVDERRVFRLRFARQDFQAAMPYERIIAVAQSPELLNQHTPLLRPPLRSWNTDRWYIVLKGHRLLEFESESQAPPPAEITSLLRDVEQLPISGKQSFLARDVCLGLCYDPLAEMGYYTAFYEQAGLMGAH